MALGDFNNTDANDNTLAVLKGGTDNTPIGNIGDRLKVEAELSNISSNNVIYQPKALLNGASRTMNVNGSVTPQNFLYTVPSNTTYYLESISIIISDNGTPTAAKFGDLAALTNGFRLQIKSNGTTYDIYNFKTNGELTLVFNSMFTPPSAGWLNDTDLMVGTLRFNRPIKLVASDFVQFTVRDNLSGLNDLVSSINLWRTI